MATGAFRNPFSDFVPVLRHARAAFFVLALGLSITYAVWQTTTAWVYGDANRKFEQEVVQGVDTLERRLRDYVNLLLGLKGLFAASANVDRDEFGRYLKG